MKKQILFVLFLFATTMLFAQQDAVYVEETNSIDLQKSKKAAVDFGVMMGGGSLIGVDLEALLVQRFGIQVGAGINSYGLGLNYHLKDKINSSFVSFVYWQQGFGDNHYASYVGPFFTWRLNKILQAGVGYGVVVKKGPAIYDTKYNDMTGSLLFNIGIYFPF